MLGVVGYLWDYPSPLHLMAFMRKYRSDAAGTTFTVVQVNGGGYDPGNPHTEANIDTQYTEAMAYPTPHIRRRTSDAAHLLQHRPRAVGHKRLVLLLA